MCSIHEHTNQNRGLSLAFWLNLLFSIVELAGGLFTNSTAIIADAFHDFMDAMAIGIAVVMNKVSMKKRSRQFSYGYKRFSLLSATGMSLLLLAGAVSMAVAAVQSFIRPREVNSVGMLWLAVLGLAVNGFAFFKIKQGERHAHSGHPHSHGNHNNRAIMLHLLEDVMGWAAVLIGAGIIYFTQWYWIDGVLTLMISIFIGYNAITNLTGTMKTMLQSVPNGIDVQQLSVELAGIKGVANVHDVHIWSLDGEYHIASLHAVVDSDTCGQEAIRDEIKQLLLQYGIQHPTIQIETSASRCDLIAC